MTTADEKKPVPPAPEAAAAAAAAASAASEKRKRKREKEKENKRTKPKIEKPAAESKPAADSSKKTGDKKNGKPNSKDAKPKLGKDGKPLRPKKPKKERDPNAPKKGPAVAKPPPPDTLDEAVAHMTPALAVDHIAQKLRHFEKDISAVELEDRLIKPSAFLDTSDYSGARTLAAMPEFIEHFEKHTASALALTEAAATPGTPHTLVVTPAAMRAMHVVRALRKFQSKDAMIAKFFAKHIKLAEAIETCENVRIGFGVGTPARILELLKNGCLKTGELVRIVLDMSAVNEKKQGLFDIKEVNRFVMDLLNYPAFRERLEEGKMKLLIY